MTVGRGMGTSGSLGIWMSLLKYSMSEARRKKFLRLQWNRETGHRGAISPLSNHALVLPPRAGTCETVRGTGPCGLAGCLLGDLKDTSGQDPSAHYSKCFPPCPRDSRPAGEERVTVAWPVHSN